MREFREHRQVSFWKSSTYKLLITVFLPSNNIAGILGHNTKNLTCFGEISIMVKTIYRVIEVQIIY